MLFRSKYLATNSYVPFITVFLNKFLDNKPKGFLFDDIDIDDMMGSDLRYNYEKPSELEVACFEAKKLVAGRKVIVLGAE